MFNPNHKVLVLNPRKGFFLEDGLHLVNPEKPFVILPAHYEPSRTVKAAIEAGILKDVNDNIIGEGAEKFKEKLKAAHEDAAKAQAEAQAKAQAEAEAQAKAQAEAEAKAKAEAEEAAKASAAQEPVADEPAADAPEEKKSKKK